MEEQEGPTEGLSEQINEQAEKEKTGLLILLFRPH